MSLITFDLQQEYAVKTGESARNSLLSALNTAINGTGKYPHAYVHGDPGIGKSFELDLILNKCSWPFAKISGDTSMFAYGLELAVLAMNHPTGKIIVVHDDQDMLLKNTENIDIAKNMLDGDKKFSYNKHIGGVIKNCNSAQRKAFQRFTNQNGPGYTVPTDRFVMIFLSNIQLPTKNDIRAVKDKTTPKYSKMRGLEAIRSRVMPLDLKLDQKSIWGWVANATLTQNVVNNLINDDIKMLILDWMWNNLEDLNELSIRTVIKMAEQYVQDPVNHKNVWANTWLDR